VPGSRVLIVDDEPDILLMLRVTLDADGFQTALAADGQSALKRIEEERFDCVLLDVMMPVMDGWQVLEALQRAPVAPRVIVVSAKSAGRDVARALRLGAADYVTKPFDVAGLGALVQQVISWSEDELAGHRAAVLQRVGDA
jgi:DNA-binding response OmpR family regulator